MIELYSIIVGGAALGLLHSFDPDHLAAMSTLVGRARRTVVGDFVQGATWGVGHTLSLAVFGAVLIALGAQISGSTERVFEAGVGVLLIVLGLRRLRDARRGPHLHFHRHGDTEHAHVHLHPAGTAHDAAVAHTGHSHAPLWVGLLHGLAGTGGVMILLPAVVLDSIGLYGAYVLAFGLGSVLSMGTLCAGLGGAMTGLRARFDGAGRWLAGIAGAASFTVGIVWLAVAVSG